MPVGRRGLLSPLIPNSSRRLVLPSPETARWTVDGVVATQANKYGVQEKSGRYEVRAAKMPDTDTPGETPSQKAPVSSVSLAHATSPAKDPGVFRSSRAECLRPASSFFSSGWRRRRRDGWT